MTEKTYDNLQEKYKNSVFQILKVCKIRTLERFGNFNFNLAIRKKYTGLRNCLEIRS